MPLQISNDRYILYAAKKLTRVGSRLGVYPGTGAQNMLTDLLQEQLEALSQDPSVYQHY